MTDPKFMDDTVFVLPKLIEAGLREAILKVFPDVDPGGDTASGLC
jgi:hypothetical protein